jgi:hypothetical protein
VVKRGVHREPVRVDGYGAVIALLISAQTRKACIMENPCSTAVT